MWITAALVAYFLLAIVALIDKYLLQGPIPNPKFYSFATGALNSVVFLLIPFGVFVIPPASIILWGLLTGACYTFALLILFTGLQKFEASRIIPAIGGITPISTALLAFLLAKEQQLITPPTLFAFLLLVGGTVGVSIQKRTGISIQSLLSAFGASFLFSGSLVSAKFVYEDLPFFSALLWIMLGSFFTSLFFLFFKEVRKELGAFFRKREKPKISSSNIFLFFLNKALAGTAIFLQYLAVALAPFGYLPFIHAMAGFQYAFLFFFVFLLSRNFPHLLKEDIFSQVLLPKTISVSLIVGGLVLLALSQ